MIVTTVCYECSTVTNSILDSNRKVECSHCNTENDFWLVGDEIPDNHK